MGERRQAAHGWVGLDAAPACRTTHANLFLFFFYPVLFQMKLLFFLYKKFEFESSLARTERSILRGRQNTADKNTVLGSIVSSHLHSSRLIWPRPSQRQLEKLPVGYLRCLKFDASSVLQCGSDWPERPNIPCWTGKSATLDSESKPIILKNASSFYSLTHNGAKPF